MPKSLTTLCGSLHYVAPELLKNHPYDESADMWSVGVIVYFLLAGYLPFHNKNQNELYKAIRLGKYTFDAEYWKDTSEESNRLIARLLTVDPSTRCTAAEALHSDWIQSVEKSQLSQHELANSLAGISKTRSRLKSVAKTVQWMNKGNRMSSLTAATNVSNLTVDSVSPGIEVPLEGISNLNV